VPRATSGRSYLHRAQSSSLRNALTAA
jgi:hypothetical protein